MKYFFQILNSKIFSTKKKKKNPDIFVKDSKHLAHLHSLFLYYSIYSKINIFPVFYLIWFGLKYNGCMAKYFGIQEPSIFNILILTNEKY